MDPREAAKKGDIEALKRIAEVDRKQFFSPDDNGWTPFHEAVRAGMREAVEIIHNSDPAHKNRLTYTGVTPLNIAREYLGKDHEVTKFLVELGAIDNHPSHNAATATKSRTTDAEL